MSFIPYSRNTVIRAYFDKYVDKKTGATLEEVAAVLGYTTKNISDAVYPRRSEVVGYVPMDKARYHSTNDHRAGWDAAEAERVMEDHISGQHRVDGMESKTEAEKAPTTLYRSRRVARPGAEDWGHLHFWAAVLKALEELVAMHKGGAREVTTEIKPKLAEHKVGGLDRVGSTLQLIRSRLGWVDLTGGDPARWYLTAEYLRLSPEEREQTLSQWDDEGKLVGRVLVTPIYEEGAVGPPRDHLVAVDNKVVVVHRFDWDGAPFGAPEGTYVMVEARLPKEMSAQERLGLFSFIMKLREDLLNLI
jgi:hypothetical protein